jgi:hypothetical protein
MGSDGRVEHVIGTAVEIAERTRLEEALQRSREDLRRYERAIFEHPQQHYESRSTFRSLALAGGVSRG